MSLSPLPPLRTVEQVKNTLARDKKRSRNGARIDLSMARAMLSVGRLTDEAREYVKEYLAREE